MFYFGLRTAPVPEVRSGKLEVPDEISKQLRWSLTNRDAEKMSQRSGDEHHPSGVDKNDSESSKSDDVEENSDLDELRQELKEQIERQVMEMKAAMESYLAFGHLMCNFFQIFHQIKHEQKLLETDEKSCRSHCILLSWEDTKCFNKMLENYTTNSGPYCPSQR